MPFRRAPLARAAALVVLVGYGLTLGASSAGHGLRLAAHLLAEHHERLEALVFGAHDHEAYDDHEAHGLAAGFHAHHGHVHSHHEEPPLPLIVTVSLDKHCLATQPSVPAPLPARGDAPAAPFEALAAVVLPVEVLPPEARA